MNYYEETIMIEHPGIKVDRLRARSRIWPRSRRIDVIYQ